MLGVQMIGEKFVTRAFFSYFSLLWYRLYDLTLTDAKCYNESRLCKIRKAHWTHVRKWWWCVVFVCCPCVRLSITETRGCVSVVELALIVFFHKRLVS